MSILSKCKERVTNVSTSLDTSDLENASKHHDAVKDCINEVFELISKNKFNINLTAYYDYLNSLTLFQEGALLHLFIFSFILVTLFNLIMTLFANELLNYFKIADKHPYLNRILTLRLKFQRYYFILNFSILFLLIIGAIILNLYILIIKI